ncbi:DNA cytosine methyltransferase [Fibrivirga algicola]|nr:DNA cytosine methyltransferase [Fibrivirga algicola]
MARFTFIDLFAGIGGFRLGLSQNGGECVAFSEIDKTAIETYCKNFNESKDYNLGDITSIKDLPKHDLLTGGVPCQSWSIAGKNLGFDDDRGQLWNDTLFLLNKSRPKAFIFENVKGLFDPRNSKALTHILERIESAGYYAKAFLIDSSDYGVPQSRIRVYIIGFHKKEYLQNFSLPEKVEKKLKLHDFLDLPASGKPSEKQTFTDLFGVITPAPKSRKELNDFFLFNDIRNGPSTVHSWDIIETTDREKQICLLLLTNRRKKLYGPYDGNPLSIEHFRNLDSSINIEDLETLVSKGILKKVEYLFQINSLDDVVLDKFENIVLDHSNGDKLWLDDVKNSRKIKQAKFKLKKILDQLKSKGLINCTELRYEFRYSKISSGINGVNRIYLPNSEVFSTLVASDTNDYVSTVNVSGKSHEDLKERFLNEVYKEGKFRKITKEEACVIQGYPKNFDLPERRDKWMKLLGNSVSVPVISELCQAIIETGVFSSTTHVDSVESYADSEIEVATLEVSR